MFLAGFRTFKGGASQDLFFGFLRHLLKRTFQNIFLNVTAKQGHILKEFMEFSSQYKTMIMGKSAVGLRVFMQCLLWASPLRRALPCVLGRVQGF